MSKFCLYAWEGIYIAPTGEYSSCCDMTPVGDYTGIRDFYTSKEMNQLRQQLLEGDEPSACERCWRKERAGLPSSRTNINKSKLNVPTAAHLQAASAAPKITMWEIRDNNLCNMACRMCGTFCSSMWNQEVLSNPDITFRHAIGDSTVLRIPDPKHKDLLKTFSDNIDTVKMLYWAGGEPLINHTHWQILNQLVEAGRTDVQLRYNTNMLKLDYRGQNAIDMWRKFTGHVGVTVSMDCTGDRAEYARHGTRWTTLADNINHLLEYFRGGTHVSITSSIYTIDALPDTLKWLHSQGVERIIYSNVLYTPEYLCVDILPVEVKQDILTRLAPYQNADDGYNQIKYMLERTPVDVEQRRADFVEYTQQIDASRDQSVHTACPELSEYMHTWRQ